MKRYISFVLIVFLLATCILPAQITQANSLQNQKAEKHSRISEDRIFNALQTGDFLIDAEEESPLEIREFTFSEELDIPDSDFQQFSSDFQKDEAEEIVLLFNGAPLETIETEVDSYIIHDVEYVDGLAQENREQLNMTENSTLNNYDQSITPYATLPDLTVTSMLADRDYVNSNGNFNAYDLAGIEFTIKNIGGGSAVFNVRVNIYFDGQYMGYLTINTIYTAHPYVNTIEIGNVPSGTHSLKLEIDPNNAIQESNKNNNSLTRSFLWESYGIGDLIADIQVSTDYIIGGWDDYNTDMAFVEFAVQNVGSGDISEPIPIDLFAYFYETGEYFYLGSETITTGLRAGKMRRGSFEFGADGTRCGWYELICMPNNDRTITEANYSNNMAGDDIRIVAGYHTGMFERHDWHQWFDSYNNMSVKIYNSAKPLMSVPDWTYYTSGGGSWNGINPNISFSSPVFIERENPTYDINYRLVVEADVMVVGYDFSRDPYKDGNTVFVDKDDTTSYRNACLVQVNDSGEYSAPGRNIVFCYVHEMGHVVGLEHPNNFGYPEYSIMNTTGTQYECYYITEADIVNVERCR